MSLQPKSLFVRLALVGALGSLLSVFALGAYVAYEPLKDSAAFGLIKKGDIIKKVLPALDDLERALQKNRFILKPQ